MNAVEIEEAVSKLAEFPFVAAEFPFQFLEAFDFNATAVNKLTNGVAPINDKPLSEPETLDAQAFDELNTNPPAAAVAAEPAAPAAPAAPAGGEPQA